jgi:hypothetical protein
METNKKTGRKEGKKVGREIGCQATRRCYSHLSALTVVETNKCVKEGRKKRKEERVVREMRRSTSADNE